MFVLNLDNLDTIKILASFHQINFSPENILCQLLKKLRETDKNIADIDSCHRLPFSSPIRVGITFIEQWSIAEKTVDLIYLSQTIL